MADDEVERTKSFERSRAHRRGVRQACADLEHALARPAGQDTAQWFSDTATRLGQLSEAFKRHAQQSEGPDGLLGEIVDRAPRLAHAVREVKRDHEVLAGEIAQLEAVISDGDDLAELPRVRSETLRLLQAIADHRQRGSDLIYEAYSVDVEGGESG